MNAGEQDRCDLVRRFFAALSDDDLEAMRAMLHPEATWEVMRAVPGERLTVGRDAIIDDFLRPVRARFATGDPKVTVHTLFASGDRVAAETHADGTMRDGSDYHNRYAWVIELDGPLVRSVHEYMDTAYARARTGVRSPSRR
jgi:ketosteroid isomerase-like protein